MAAKTGGPAIGTILVRKHGISEVTSWIIGISDRDTV